MIRANPLLAEVARGLARSGRAQRDWLAYLLLQALAVFTWWPKGSLHEALAAGDPPDALLAAILVLGATLAWYSLRAGAEELLLPGQHGLREWAATTDLGLARILCGYLCGHLLQALHLVALAMPLLLLPFTVCGGEWSQLGWLLTATVFQATFYRLAAAVVYMSIGHHGAMTVLSVRALLPLGYLATAFAAPAASHLVLSWHTLKAGAAAGAVPSPALFVLIHAVACVPLAAVLHRQLSRLRRSLARAPAIP